ncbi:hypothetical protein PTSG_05562 [Salpingoeca rosetta]|uniref:Phosphatidylcholine transfer protein n=1 Tax=Salpingoeca rosetta (strain ATCC 50818 / BSB-021) TaxID=946362 RepID=F2UBK1_SALR5|nr:uncharacterized protein PTSG_05562 [Salpingoeca rosetta]EGD73867.1 hypothetical protein PTSG_05562 [Salpingoeca rosetta]|eukprot:XP_004993430.1 hypothetical protein PTSG_05562 [Salpingoeca rosetta]
MSGAINDPNLSYEETVDAELRQAYKDFEQMEAGNTTGWEYMFDVEDWKLYRRRKEGSHLYEYMTFGHGRDMEMQLMYQVYMDLDYTKIWHAYCRDVISYEAEFEGEAQLFVVKCPFPLADREYAFVRHARQMKRNGRRMYLILSHTARDCLTNPPKTERGIVRIPEHRQVIVMEENPSDPQRPLIFMYYFDDPGGSIPSWLVNWVAKTAAPKYLSGLRTAMRGYHTWRKKYNKPIPFVEPPHCDLRANASEDADDCDGDDTNGDSGEFETPPSSMPASHEQSQPTEDTSNISSSPSSPPSSSSPSSSKDSRQQRAQQTKASAPSPSQSSSGATHTRGPLHSVSSPAVAPMATARSSSSTHAHKHTRERQAASTNTTARAPRSSTPPSSSSLSSSLSSSSRAHHHRHHRRSARESSSALGPPLGHLAFV